MKKSRKAGFGPVTHRVRLNHADVTVRLPQAVSNGKCGVRSGLLDQKEISRFIANNAAQPFNSSVAQPLKNNENQSVCDRFPIVYLLYGNFLPRFGKLLNTRWNFELGDGDARFWSAHGT